jgi:diadenosine tetraphosphate (Ap4A) HIT family hydrolase/8-oxo-dGTP pyrophosphatase MutT (NUDIX family)
MDPKCRKSPHLRGCGLIIENKEKKIFLQLRDNKPNIWYPNTWCHFGGGFEPGETPEQAIIREIKEEIDYDLTDPEYVGNFPIGGSQNYIFRKVIPDANDNTFKILEGQRGKFFSLEELKNIECSDTSIEIFIDYFQRYHGIKRNCGLCDAINEKRLIMKNNLAFAVIIREPQVPYHTLVLPIRHVTSLRDLTPEESLALNLILDEVRTRMEDVLGLDPLITLNCKRWATQEHLHYQVFPIKNGARTIMSSHLKLPEYPEVSDEDKIKMAEKLRI